MLFEHSPGRGDPRFTADRTAYDIVLRGRNATGARGLICIEIKYSEPGHEPAPPPHPRHTQIAHATPGLFVDPDAPTLTGATCQQFFRQHCLASAMLTAGLADTATLVFIAPAHNQSAHTAAATYRRHLTDPQTGPIPFVPTTLEHAFAAMATAGLPDHARALHRRYTDWWLVDGELDLAAAAAVAVSASHAVTLPSSAVPAKARGPRGKASPSNGGTTVRTPHGSHRARTTTPAADIAA